ncbi:hypothetical protein [Caballeronia sordidicola]|uniref:hypothetical protein n=1 Tax=Caballeronia sordidicola TaxID=196367 RepID=UPI00094D7D5D|nr:hypothetical protein [Caballeronia sordidicola]
MPGELEEAQVFDDVASAREVIERVMPNLQDVLQFWRIDVHCFATSATKEDCVQQDCQRGSLLTSLMTVKVRWTVVQSKTIVGGLITDSLTYQRQSYSWVAAVHVGLFHIPKQETLTLPEVGSSLGAALDANQNRCSVQ